MGDRERGMHGDAVKGGIKMEKKGRERSGSKMGDRKKGMHGDVVKGKETRQRDKQYLVKRKGQDTQARKGEGNKR